MHATIVAETLNFIMALTKTLYLIWMYWICHVMADSVTVSPQKVWCNQDRPLETLVGQTLLDLHWLIIDWFIMCAVMSYQTAKKEAIMLLPLKQSCSLSSLNPLYVHCHCCSIMCYNICWYHTPHAVLLVNASKPGFCATGFKSWFELEAAAEGKILSALKSQKLNGR